MSNRLDAVWIRKSTDAQAEKGQIANVKKMLKQATVSVTDGMWFIATGSRRTIRENIEFKRLMSFVESDTIGTIFIESRSRIGTVTSSDLYAIIGTLQDHGTKLVELETGKDLTDEDIATDLTNVIGAHTNKAHLDATAYQGLRSKVQHFMDTGSWPSGPQPFGYGKACHSASGVLKWEFEPTSRERGIAYHAGDDGTLFAGMDGSKIPRKDKSDIVKLIPSRDKKRIETIKLIFDLYVREGLSFRAIANRVTDAGYTHYGNPISFSLVSQILKNPHYTGDVHFGKTKSANFRSFDKDANITAVESKPITGVKTKQAPRDVEDQLVKKDVHEPLISRAVWSKAQKRLAKDKQTKSWHGSRNAKYYLKGILYCGHCGGSMQGCTSTDKERTVGYVCASYKNGGQKGNDKCGYFHVKHDDIEELLMAKLKELDVEFDNLIEAGKLTDLNERIVRLLPLRQPNLSKKGRARLLVKTKSEEHRRANALVDEMVDAFVQYAGAPFKGLTKKDRKAAVLFYESASGPEVDKKQWDNLGMAITAAEKEAVEGAKIKLAEKSELLRKYTLAKATASEMQSTIFTSECDQLEAEIRDLKPKTRPVAERLDELEAEEARQLEERKNLLADWTTIPQRERGEAFKRFFSKVILKWSKEWHSAEAKPKRERKTDRKGRWKYTLLSDEITWELTASEMSEGT